MLAKDLAVGKEELLVPAKQYQSRHMPPVGMACSVVITLAPIDPHESGAVRVPGVPQQHQQRQADGDDDAFDHADEGHAEEADQRQGEFHAPLPV